MLRYLVENPGRLITHDELLDALWPETYVQPQILRTYMLELRKLLCDDAGQPRFIQTLPKRGYCFVATVVECEETKRPRAAAALATIPAVAETATVNVPFNFTVAGQNLPAGNYFVQRDHLSSFVKLQSQQAPQAFVWTASPSATQSKAASLIFDREGEKYILRSVQSGTMVTIRLDRKRASDSERTTISAGQ